MQEEMHGSKMCGNLLSLHKYFEVRWWKLIVHAHTGGIWGNLNDVDSQKSYTRLQSETSQILSLITGAQEGCVWGRWVHLVTLELCCDSKV